MQRVRLKLTQSQRSMLVWLFNSPRRTNHIPNEQTAAALIRKGYAERANGTHERKTYCLTQAGIRYNQTGKEIGQ